MATWAFLSLSPNSTGLNLEELPIDGTTLTVSANSTLMIGGGESAYLNGTVLVQGDKSEPVVLSIRNLGNLTIGNGVIRCVNASLHLNNSGLVRGGSLILESLSGANLTVENPETISLRRIEYFCHQGSTMLFNDEEDSVTTFGTWQINNEGNMEIGAWGRWEGDSFLASVSNDEGLEMLLAGVFDLGTIKLAGGDHLSIMGDGNASLGKMEWRGTGSLQNDGSLKVNELFATDRTEILNDGSLQIEQMRLYGGTTDDVLLSNRGNLSVEAADINIFSPGTSSLITLDCGGMTRLQNLEILCNVPLPPGGTAEYFGLINLSCPSRGVLEIGNLKAGTAGPGRVQLTLGCDAYVNSAFVQGDTDIICKGMAEFGKLSAPGDKGPLELSEGESLIIEEVELVVLSGSLRIPEAIFPPATLRWVAVGGIIILLSREESQGG